MSSAEQPRAAAPSAAWASAEPPRVSRSESAVARFLGGSPGAVFIRLLLLSFFVGVLLMWLDVRPQDVILAIQRFAEHIWNLGFDAVREGFNYIAAGALIVVPIWLVVRLLNLRSVR